MGAPLEQILDANFALVWAAYSWKNDQATARRIKLWADVPRTQRPALFQFEGGNHDIVWTGEGLPKGTIEIKLFAYTDASDMTQTGSTQINNIFDAIKAAYTPTGADALRGRRVTLGGTVQHARIEGQVFRDPGDIDGDGLLIVPVKILLP